MRRPNPDPTESRDLGEVLDFLRLLWSIEHLLKSASKRMQRRLGITGPQRLVIRVVEQFPELTAGELAGILHLHPSTVTGVVERLVQRRLLIRTRDEADQRRVRLRIGSRIPAATRASTVEDSVSDVLDSARPAEVRSARHVLEMIVSALEDHAADQIPPARTARTVASAKTPRRKR